MKIVGVGQIIFWDDGSLWIGVSRAETDFHAHLAIQISLGLKGKVGLQARADGPRNEYAAAIIPSGVSHAFQSEGSVTANIFCEPQSNHGRRLITRFGSDEICAIPGPEVSPLIDPLREAYASGASEARLIETAKNLVAGLSSVAPRTRLADTRIDKATAFIAREISDEISLRRVAEEVALSPHRLRHLFVEEVGVGLRQYILWRRLRRALEEALSGASWTDAAHAANFADAAHLTRTFKKMFGISPTGIDRAHPDIGRIALSPSIETDPQSSPVTPDPNAPIS